MLLKAGQMTSVRSGDNSGPVPPTQAPLDLLVATSKDTDVTGQLGLQGTGPHLGPWGVTAIFVAIPAIVIPIIVTHKNPGTLTPPPGKGCVPNPQTGFCP